MKKKIHSKFKFFNESLVIGLLLSVTTAYGQITCIDSLNCGEVQFNSVGARVTIPHHAVYEIGTGDFTLEGWIKGTGSSVEGALLSKRTSVGTDGFLFRPIGGQAKQLLLQLNGYNYYSDQLTSSLYDNTFHHIAVTRLESTITFYVDGEVRGTQTSLKSMNSLSPLYIGYDVNDQISLNGVTIDDVRIWSVARTISEIKANKSVIVPGNSTGLIGYWNMSIGMDSYQHVYDGSIVANNGILGSNNASENIDPVRVLGTTFLRPQSGLTFDGVDDRAEIPATMIYPTEDNFTIEAWINMPSNQTSANPTILSRRSTTTNGFKWSVNNGTQLVLQINGVDYGSAIFPDIYDNNCHHVAVRRTNGTLTFFLDGIILNGTFSAIKTNLKNPRPIWIGNDFVASNPFKGTINEIRIWKKSVSAKELYDNRNVVLPSGMFGLVGYWTFQEPGSEKIINSGSLQTGYGFLGSDAIQFDAQNPIRLYALCFTGDKQSFDNWDDFNEEKNVTIYPNPFVNETSVLINDVEGQGAHIRILDLNGKMIKDLDVTQAQLSIGNELPKGIYIVEVEVNGKVDRYKIVKAE